MSNEPVLIVEDEHLLAELIAGKLEANGIPFQETDNYPEALSRLSNQKYGLMIVDMHINKGNGEDLIRRIRTDPKHINHRLPIIVTSGHLDGKLTPRLVGMVQGAFVKPYELSKLVEVVQKHRK